MRFNQLSQFVKSEDGTKFSSSRLWFHLANAVATGVYIYASYHAAIATTINLEGLAWYTLVYMGLVTGNKFANKFLSARYGGSNDTSRYDSKREETITQ